MQGPPDLRIAVTLLILLGVFILCWTPAIILSITGAVGYHVFFHPVTFVIVTTFIFIVPACNPVVYSLRNSQFRAAATEFLQSIGALCVKKATWTLLHSVCNLTGVTKKLKYFSQGHILISPHQNEPQFQTGLHNYSTLTWHYRSSCPNDTTVKCLTWKSFWTRCHSPWLFLLKVIVQSRSRI